MRRVMYKKYIANSNKSDEKKNTNGITSWETNDKCKLIKLIII
jgi:hypothetical protein